MKSGHSYTSGRLVIMPCELDDFEFIFKLLNSAGWIRFIGNRNVNSPEEAKAYIQKIHEKPGVTYWVVRAASDLVPVGIITLIKRDYMEYPDIGFAFLPEFAGQGYALEAVQAVLKKPPFSEYRQLMAQTIPENASSIKLLTKLGFKFLREEEIENEKFRLYILDPA